MDIRPQEGYQENVLSSPADLVISGSAAGVGKSYALLLEPLKHITRVKGFGGEIFRRTRPMIRNEGGLWDTSQKIYPHIGASPKESKLIWVFPNGNKIAFSQLEYEKTKLGYQGSQIAFIGFDELTHFTSTQFFYLVSRNRSTCGVRPYIRATCNPDPDSWVADFIAWWIDEEGNSISEREGVLRYFTRDGGTFIWGDSFEEVYEKAEDMIKVQVEKSDGLATPEDFIKSLTFISGDIYENKELLKVDPGYLGSLNALDEAEKRRLLHANWKHIEKEDDLFSHAKMSGAFYNNYEVANGHRRIVADIATSGKNYFVVGVFDGRQMDAILLLPKSSGKLIITEIEAMATIYGIPNDMILFDGDGVGSFIGGLDDYNPDTDKEEMQGFIPGSISFHGNGSVIEVIDPRTKKPFKPEFKNLKTQCAYSAGNAFNGNLYRIMPEVGNTIYNDKFPTVKKRMLWERKAIKKYKKDHDGKKQITPKKLQKEILQGDSPDLMDVIIMNEFFELSPKKRSFERTFTKRNNFRR